MYHDVEMGNAGWQVASNDTHAEELPGATRRANLRSMFRHHSFVSVTWSLAFVAAVACEPTTRPAPPTKVEAPVQAKVPEVRAEPVAEPEPEPTGPQYVEAGGVQYLEIVTGKNVDTNSALPMIIAIHGLGDRPENFADLLRAFPEPARVIFPRALDDHEEGFSWFPIRARSKDIDALSDGITVAADKLAEMTKAVQASRPTLGKPIVTGFSQGGMLSFTLASRHAELFAAAVPLGGWLPDPLWPKQKPASKAHNPPVVALHGDADRALLIDRTRTSVAAQKKLGYSVELKEYPDVGHQITLEMRNELYALLTTFVREQTAAK